MNIFLFDIDGTLISTLGAGRTALERSMSDGFGVDQKIEPEMILGQTDRGIAEALFQLHNIENTAENWHKLQAGYLVHLPQSLAEREGRILPNVENLLAELACWPNTHIGLLTGNTRVGAQVKLQHFNLWHHFTVVGQTRCQNMWTEDTALPVPYALGGFGDEHPHRFEVARQAVSAMEGYLDQQVPPDCVWVIGDTPLDVRCARAVGAHAVAVCTGWHQADILAKEEPDLLLDDLSQLPVELFLRDVS